MWELLEYRSMSSDRAVFGGAYILLSGGNQFSPTSETGLAMGSSARTFGLSSTLLLRMKLRAAPSKMGAPASGDFSRATAGECGVMSSFLAGKDPSSLFGKWDEYLTTGSTISPDLPEFRWLWYGGRATIENQWGGSGVTVVGGLKRALQFISLDSLRVAEEFEGLLGRQLSSGFLPTGDEYRYESGRRQIEQFDSQNVVAHRSTRQAVIEEGAMGNDCTIPVGFSDDQIYQIPLTDLVPPGERREDKRVDRNVVTNNWMVPTYFPKVYNPQL
ncbi:hypothetical protein H4582DRAFT_2058998 [Lactarius indigo]|nr:hypothetical protein H4582DRAFT_2058998 [Lactarius indigo]